MAARNLGITCAAVGCVDKESPVIPVRRVADAGMSHSGETSCSHSQIGMPFLTRIAPMSMTRTPDAELIVSVSTTTASAMDAFMQNSVNGSKPPPARAPWDGLPPIGANGWFSSFFLPFFEMA